MGVPTYQPVASTTLGSSGVRSITFSNITQQYRDLVVVMNWGNSANTNFLVRFNGDSGSNYHQILANGNGTGTQTFTATNIGHIEIGYIWNDNIVTGTFKMNVMDYSASDKHKTVLNRTGDQQTGADMLVGRWANNTPITSLTIIGGSSSTFTVGSTIAVYGILA